MLTQVAYPKYNTYEEIKKVPSLLLQVYPKPVFEQDEIYYPENQLIAPYLSSQEDRRKFGAASFCGFLEDTIEVEHCLVIPAVAALRRLPYQFPPKIEQDLFKTATDEGYHAEQSLLFLDNLRAKFQLKRPEHHTPLFLRRLEHQRSLEFDPFYRDLVTVLNGVVTETRISRELGEFAADKTLAESVRDVCRSHAEDEAVHASQFRALGQWLWDEFNEAVRFAAASFVTASTIARSLPDIDRIAYFLHQSTGRSHVDCKEIVYSTYTEDVLIEIMLFAARPTIAFFQRLGTENYVTFSQAIERERESLAVELEAKRKRLHC